MNNTVEYLRLAKMDEISEQMRGQGYQVIVRPNGQDEGFDLIASKNGDRIAFVLQSQAGLKLAAPEIERLRAKARERGYQGFRLHILTPPHTTSARIEGVEQVLMQYLVQRSPAELQSLAEQAQIVRVAQPRLDSVDIDAGGIRAIGTAVVVVELSGAGEDRSDYDTDFPVNFDLFLDHTLAVRDVYRCQIDTSSWDS